MQGDIHAFAGTVDVAESGTVTGDLAGAGAPATLYRRPERRNRGA